MSSWHSALLSTRTTLPIPLSVPTLEAKCWDQHNVDMQFARMIIDVIGKTLGEEEMVICW
jgi:hypothetical protein